MSNNFIASVVRRLNLNLLLISLTGLLLVFLGLGVSWRYLYNMMLGPFPIDRADVLALNGTDDLVKYYVTVAGDDHVDTGYAYISQSDSGSETTEAYYYALIIEHRLLLVKSRTASIDNTVTGALVNLPTDERTKVIAELEKEAPQVKGAFLPILLDATDFYIGGYVGLAIAALIGLLSVAGAGLALYRIMDPSAHPALKALGRYGALEAVTAEIDMEMAAAHEQVGKRIHFTRRWLVSTVNGLGAIPFRDLMWGYKQVTQHRMNGIPTGKTYAARLFDRFGKILIVAGKQADVDLVLRGVARLAPGVIMGYSEELRKLWQNDRAGFVAAVEARRRSSAVPPAV